MDIFDIPEEIVRLFSDSYLPIHLISHPAYFLLRHRSLAGSSAAGSHYLLPALIVHEPKRNPFAQQRIPVRVLLIDKYRLP
jgi:hypothetical protein